MLKTIQLELLNIRFLLCLIFMQSTPADDVVLGYFGQNGTKSILIFISFSLLFVNYFLKSQEKKQKSEMNVN